MLVQSSIQCPEEVVVVGAALQYFTLVHYTVGSVSLLYLGVTVAS